MKTFVAALAMLQVFALLMLAVRLLPGRRRMPAVEPAGDAENPATVTIIVATLNEAARIGPCLNGLKAQGNAVIETLFVDSNSTDGTREFIEAACQFDSRMQLLSDAPQPEDWIGKVWALETGRQRARGEWILGIDADTIPEPGMVNGILRAMQHRHYDAASFGPRFVGQTAAERWLQPAMLMTLIYRCGAAGAGTSAPDRVLANGQCFMVRRATLEANGGYAIARHSFSDDVTLARHLARNGARVGFLDGSRIISVRAYRSASEMWREWGRSFDLKDSATKLRRWMDVGFVWLTMAFPLPVLAVIGYAKVMGAPAMPGRAAMTSGITQAAAPTNAMLRDGIEATLQSALQIDARVLPLWIAALAATNALLLGVRILLVVAIRGSYGERGWPFWMSVLADIPAAVRLTMSTAKRPRLWRGRRYPGRPL